MRFVLDEDTDAGVCRHLRRMKHQCWTAPNAGLNRTDDDEISVYADAKDAALVSHDRELAERRIKHTFGQHVWLRCRQSEAVDVVKERLAELLDDLEQHEVGVFEVRHDSVRYHRGSWGTL
jgi:predicted nuclease of predicted toxin-antitoxin system